MKKELNEKMLDKIAVAKKMTARNADIKDWRLTNRTNRAMRGVACEWVANKDGYMLATVSELRKYYPTLCHYTDTGSDEVFVWGIEWSITRSGLQFVAI